MSVDQRVLAAAKKVTAHRAKIVIDHIIKHGSISTEELKVKYGYAHPPRAAADVRDQGIPLAMFKVTGSDGRKIAAYRFGSATEIEAGKLGGRRVLPKQLKEALIELHGPRCAITCETYDKNYLQIDHRIPYRVAGDTADEHKVDDYMLLCGSAQRQKSWACEHCENYLKFRKLDTCRTCYWARPENYEHVAMQPEKQITIVFRGTALQAFNKLADAAKRANKSPADVLRDLIK